MTLKVTIIEFSAKQLIGMKVTTDMQKAAVDCPALWQAFGPHIAQLPGGLGNCSYGVSVMGARDGAFDYWAAIEESADTILPTGLEKLSLPAGLYACSEVANLGMLAKAYGELYANWDESPGYAVDWRSPCFERYPADWKPTDPLDIFVPVTKI